MKQVWVNWNDQIRKGDVVQEKGSFYLVGLPDRWSGKIVNRWVEKFRCHQDIEAAAFAVAFDRSIFDGDSKMTGKINGLMSMTDDVEEIE